MKTMSQLPQTFYMYSNINLPIILQTQQSKNKLILSMEIHVLFDFHWYSYYLYFTIEMMIVLNSLLYTWKKETWNACSIHTETKVMIVKYN